MPQTARAGGKRPHIPDTNALSLTTSPARPKSPHSRANFPRSKDTIARVKAAQVADLATDTALVKECDVVLSVVPPRDAEATAQRLIDALALVTRPHAPLYFADMNAVAPSTIKRIAASIAAANLLPSLTLIDGSILGGPPRRTTDPGAGDPSAPTAAADDDEEWTLPSMPTSGPVGFADIPGYGAALARALNATHIAADVGASSGLKMCFASLSKGYAAVALQSYTTAHRLGVLPALQAALGDMMPGRAAQTEAVLVGVAPKAYRWVREMDEIARTHAEVGGFELDLFRGAAGVFRAVAEDTVLGAEKIGARKRGRTAEDVAAAMAEGLERKRKKRD